MVLLKLAICSWHRHFTHYNPSKIISQSVSALILVENFKFKSITMVAPNKSIKEEASKPKLRSLKARIQRIKKDMGKIRKGQTSIREDQMKIGERLRDIKRKCDELRLETQVIVKQSALNRIEVSIMFNMLRARQDGHFYKAAALK